MFTALSERLTATLKRLTGRGVLSEQDVTEALREIRRHLLEADVSFEVTTGFVERVRERAVGVIAVKSVSPGQQVAKLVHDEIAALLGGTKRTLDFASVGPTVILLVGLQGSGKTTTAAKLARRLKLEQKAPGLVAADVYRPAAAEQLRQLGEQIGVPVLGTGDGGRGKGEGGPGSGSGCTSRSRIGARAHGDRRYCRSPADRRRDDGRAEGVESSGAVERSVARG